jgi:hypothetical protein
VCAGPSGAEDVRPTGLWTLQFTRPSGGEVDCSQVLRTMQTLVEEQLGGLWLLHGRNNDGSSDEPP